MKKIVARRQPQQKLNKNLEPIRLFWGFYNNDVAYARVPFLELLCTTSMTKEMLLGNKCNK
jgi:hypothetical protein